MDLPVLVWGFEVPSPWLATPWHPHEAQQARPRRGAPCAPPAPGRAGPSSSPCLLSQGRADEAFISAGFLPVKYLIKKTYKYWCREHLIRKLMRAREALGTLPSLAMAPWGPDLGRHLGAGVC